MMPGEFGYQGAGCLQLCPDHADEEDGNILIYDEDLNQTASIAFAGAEKVPLEGWYQYRTEKYNYETNQVELVWSEIRDNSRSETKYSYAEIYTTIDGLDGDYCAATQTAFNSDSKFEYLVPKYEIVNYTYENEDQRGGGTELICTGFQVISQDGTKLFDIDIPNEYESSSSSVGLLSIGKKNPKQYLRIMVTSKADPYQSYSLIYALEGQNKISSPKVVSAGMKVNPTMPRHGESVRVDLGEAASHVDLISANGAKVRSVAVKGDSRSVTIPTEGLTSGVYVVTANSREAAKIIIR